ncbi:Phosphatidylglycerol--prolipoprotein diacylglyceryl transferase [Thermoflexales bacterium]|nr:Phosphatidylglycerol--prolipoprotein diacylglyceryl transferase [Thermoflexales bacterium]
MFPVIQLGPLSIQARGLILLVAFWLSAEVAERGAKRLGLRGEVVYSLAFVAAVAGVIGARIGYVLEHWLAYQSDLGAIVALNFNTLSPLAGAIAGVLVAYLSARRKGLAHRLLLDALTPGFIVLAGGLALADLASGDAYGSPSSLPWAIELWGAARHPTPIYQLIAVVAIGLIVLKTDRVFDGARFGWFVALSASSRLFIEAFRGDSETFGGVRTAQVWSLLVLLLMLVLLRRWAKSAGASAANDGHSRGSGNPKHEVGHGASVRRV